MDETGTDDTLLDSGLGSARTSAPSWGSRSQPEQIGPYRVLMRLGSGGMGDVYLVEHDGLKQRYALKLIRPDLALDPQVRGRFKRECETLAQVDTHPGIVRVHGAALEPLPYLVMEFVQGRSLLRALRDGMPESAVLDVLVETADALGYAHARGLVHRDVKPGNILVDVEGHARLTDFGLAKVFAQVDHEHLTVTGEVIGTPTYMAPEQVNDELGPVGPRTDVYALGAVLYEALLGYPPHVADSAIEVFERLISNAQIAKLRTQRRDVSPALEAVCLKALSHDPQDRQPHAGVFAAELREARSAEAPQRGTAGGRKRAHAAGLAALAFGIGVALGIGWERTRIAEPPLATHVAERSGLPPPSAEDPQAIAPTPRPTPTGPRLIAIEQVPRLRPAELALGRVVTVRSPSEDRLYLAALLKDAGDDGYDVLYADGHTERAGIPKGGFLPDLFLPGAQVERILIAGGEFADGVIVERRGQAVLVESEGERRWIPIWQVRVRKDQRVTRPGKAPRGELVMARYSGGELFYAAVALERKAGKVRALYLLDGDQEWRTTSAVRRLPRVGDPVIVVPYDGSDPVTGVLEQRLGEIAVQVRLGDARVVWVALCQLRTGR